jgi:hypothetical protein
VQAAATTFDIKNQSKRKSLDWRRMLDTASSCKVKFTIQVKCLFCLQWKSANWHAIRSIYEVKILANTNIYKLNFYIKMHLYINFGIYIDFFSLIKQNYSF